MITTLTELVPYVAAQLPGCPSNTVNFMLRQMARSFFEQTEVWQKNLALVSLVEDQADYELAPAEIADDEPDVLKIVWAKKNEVEVPQYKYDLRLSSESAGEPPVTRRFFVLRFGDDYIPEDDDTDALEVRVVLAPGQQGANISVDMLDRYGVAIASGARYYLAAQQGRAWSNAAVAAQAYNEYSGGVAKAVKEKYTGRKDASMTINMPRWI